MTGSSHAALNAALNASSGALITAGWWAIRSGWRRLHIWMMGSATAVSALFLVSYLARVLTTGTHRYPGSGAWRAIYLGVLGSHMILAVITPPLVIRTIYLAARDRLAEHRRLVRYTLPIWLYVSVTGVLVYLLLYHPPG